MLPESWRLGSLVVVVVVVGLLLPHCGESLSCQRAHENAHEVEGCPVKTARHPSAGNCVSVRVWIRHGDLRQAPTIEIASLRKETIRPVFKYKRTKKKWHRRKNGNEIQVPCHEGSERPGPHSNATLSSWELLYDCVETEGRHPVTVSYSAASVRCSLNYTLPEPVPDFSLSVDRASKSINVTVRSESKVRARWCYKQSAHYCVQRRPSNITVIDPSRTRSALLSFPYVLPCVCVQVCSSPVRLHAAAPHESPISSQFTSSPSPKCETAAVIRLRERQRAPTRERRNIWNAVGSRRCHVSSLCRQVFYTHADPVRKTACPLQGVPLADAEDVWRSSAVTLYESSLTWSSVCPARGFPVSASLCWRRGPDVCVPSPNSSLPAREDGTDLIFDISAVDRHPRICVKFSLAGSHSVSCPFRAETPSWHVSLQAGPGAPSVYVKSSAAATFSAQICVPGAGECAARGPVRAVAAEAASASRMDVPLASAEEGACVQVWRSFPALKGRRIVCPHDTRGRWGARAAAAFFLLAALAFLAIFLHSLVTKGATARLSIRKPVLLVCSSERSRHISAARALASVLRGDLSATVHLALGGAGAGPESGVADLGPLPWLYGQWEAVREARGKVLIIWSPEANGTYGEWRRRRRRGGNHEADDRCPPDGGRPGQPETDGAGARQDTERATEYEPSAVIQPVFAAALACLEGALRRRKGGEVALVYFRGLGRSGDIPRSFRDVPRYCIPRDLGGLIRELGGLGATKKTPRWRCLRRLLSKGASVWLARQLARRLRTLLPPVQQRKGPR